MQLKSFFQRSKLQQDKITKHLAEFYLETIKDSQLFENIHYTKLNDIDESLPKIDALIDEKANLRKAYKRKSKENTERLNYTNDNFDKDFENLLLDLGIIALA